MDRIAKFSLPEKGEIFIDLVLERSKNLSVTRIWEGLSPLRLDAWMNNFHTALDRYFAACILDALIYRSKAQTVALLEQLFHRSLVDLARAFPPSDNIGADWLDVLRSPINDPKVRLVPVLRSSDPPTKSGLLMARLCRRNLGIGERWMIWPWKIGEARSGGINTFIFIDDFLGTGSQFSDFSKQFNLRSQLSDAYAAYAPLVAHTTGIETLKRDLPFLHVCSAELLTRSHGLFDVESSHFSDGINSPVMAGEYYRDMLTRRRLTIKRGFRDGYGRLALAYSFEHSTPNNCLPLLWHRETAWEPLFER